MSLSKSVRKIVSTAGVVILSASLACSFISFIPKAEAATGDLYITGGPSGYTGRQSNIVDRITFPGFNGFTSINVTNNGGYGIKNDGKVYAWGDVLLADGSGNSAYYSDYTFLPKEVTQLSDVVKVIPYTSSVSYALKNDGTVWSWGYDYSSQLARGQSMDYTPGQVTSLSGVTDLVYGTYKMYALKNDGTVWAWGSNYNGQLGIEQTGNITTPTQVSGLSGVTKISTASGFGNRTFAVKNDGTLWAWGENYNGELGFSSEYPYFESAPVQVPGLANITDVSISQSHNLLLNSSGQVYSWGSGYSGALGQGNDNDISTPTIIPGLSGVSKIFTNYNYSIVQKTDGTVWGTGSNSDGQLGQGRHLNSYNSFVVIPGIKYPKSIHTMYAGVYYLADSNTIITPVTISAAEGALFGLANGLYTPIPNTSNFIRLDAASGNYIALKNDGTVWTGSGVNQPQQVSGISDVKFVTVGESVQDGPYYFAIKNDGTLWSWGANNRGRMGVGLELYGQQVETPTQVPGISNVVFAAAGSDHSGAITADNKLYLWGMNSYRQVLGVDLANYPDQCDAQAYDPYCHTPIEIPGISATKVAVGDNSNTDSDDAATFILKTDGTVMAFGTNAPLWDLSTLTDITDIALDHTYGHVLGAIKNDGTVWTWGVNNYGQLGRDTEGVDNAIPGQVPGINNAYKIGTTFQHMSIIKTDGTVWSWGYGNNGNGEAYASSTPVQVPGIYLGKDISRNPDVVLMGTQGENNTPTPPTSCNVSSLGNGAGSGSGNVNTNVLLCVSAGVLTIYAGDSNDDNDICTPTNIANGNSVSVEASNDLPVSVTCNSTENSLALSTMYVSSSRQSATATLDDVVFEDLRGLSASNYTITATVSDFADGSKSIALGSNPDGNTSDTDPDAPQDSNNGKIFATLNCSGGTITPLRNAQVISEGVSNYQRGSSTTVIDSQTSITLLSTTQEVKPGRIDLDGCSVKLRVPAFVQAGNYSGTIVQTII